MTRAVKQWQDDNPNLPVFSNYRLYSFNEMGVRIPDPRVTIYRSPQQWKRYKNGLLVCDEISKYINSLKGWTDANILKALLDLAANLSKQDLEFMYSDQHSKSLHKRVRINVNRVYSPTYENPFDTVTYFVFPTIEDYEDRNLHHMQGPFKFKGSEVFPFFDTKEIIIPRNTVFKPERELEKVANWFKRVNLPWPGDNYSDSLALFQVKNHVEWSKKQEAAVRALGRIKYGSS